MNLEIKWVGDDHQQRHRLLNKIARVLEEEGLRMSKGVHSYGLGMETWEEPPEYQREVNRDREMWERGHIVMIGDYSIKPKLDFPKDSKKHGWVVCKNGCNALPGATYGETIEDATMLLHVITFLGGEENDPGGKKFWALVRALQWAKGERT